MRVMKKSILAGILFFSLGSGLLLTPSAHAVDLRTHWIDKNKPPHYTMWRKAGRGLTNIALGWTEMVYQPVLMAEKGNRWPIALFGGVTQGAFYTVGRALAGVYEVVTFPVAIPLGYQPIIKPEFVMPRDRNVKL